MTYRWAPLRMACRCLWVLALVVGLGILYLMMVGFPAKMTKALQASFLDKGYEVRIKRIRLHPRHGVVAHEPAVFLHPEDRLPALEAEYLAMGFDPQAWWQGQLGLNALRLENAVARVALSGTLTDDEDEHLRIDRLSAEISFETHGIRLNRLEARFCDMEWRGQGLLYRDPDALTQQPPPDADWWRDVLAPHQEWLSRLNKELRQLRPAEPPVVVVDFFLHPQQPELSRWSAHMQAGETRFRGLLFENWTWTVRGETREVNGLLHVAAPDGRRLHAQGWHRQSDGMAFAQLDCDLLPVYWRNAMPAGVRAHMEKARINFLGPTAVALTVGPAPPSEWGNSIEGWVEAEEVEAHGVWLPMIRSEIRWVEEEVKLERITARIGRGAGSGPAEGEVTVSLNNQTYRGSVRASFDAREVLPIAGYSPNAARIIQSLAFDEPLPEIDVAFSGQYRRPGHFHFAGRVRGEHFAFTGSKINVFDSFITLTNRVLRLDPLYAERDEGVLTGWYEHDFNRRIARLDVQSGVDPRTLIRIGGGAVERILRPFRFEGPVQLEVAGTVDLSRHEQTDYRAVGVAENVAWRWLQAERCAMEWIAKGDRITMTNVQMSLHGGTVQGDGTVDGIGSGPPRYTAQGRVAGLSFPGLLRDLRQTEADVQEGVLSGRFALKGRAEQDWRASLEGEGRVRIRDGQVFQVRLFGGLSELLGMIYPRLGSVTQNDVRADFEISDRRVHSDEIRIEGAILSLRGQGAYHLDDELDFKVQVQPLRRGFLVDAIRVVTYPVSRLLQFHLRGSLSQPQWSIDNLPRDLWSVFERAPVEEE